MWQKRKMCQRKNVLVVNNVSRVEMGSSVNRKTPNHILLRELELSKGKNTSRDTINKTPLTELELSKVKDTSIMNSGSSFNRRTTGRMGSSELEVSKAKDTSSVNIGSKKDQSKKERTTKSVPKKNSARQKNQNKDKSVNSSRYDVILRDRRTLPPPGEVQRQRLYPVKYFLSNRRRSFEKLASESQSGRLTRSTNARKLVQNREASSQLEQSEHSSTSSEIIKEKSVKRNKNETQGYSKSRPERKECALPLRHVSANSETLEQPANQTLQQLSSETIVQPSQQAESSHNVLTKNPVGVENIRVSAKARFDVNNVEDMNINPSTLETALMFSYCLRIENHARTVQPTLNFSKTAVTANNAHVPEQRQACLRIENHARTVQPTLNFSKTAVTANNAHVPEQRQACLRIENHARTVQPTLNFSKTAVTANNAHVPEQRQASTHKKQKLSEKDRFEDRVKNNRTSILSKKSLSEKDKRQYSLPRRPVKEPLKGGHCVTFVEESAASFVVADVSVEPIQQSATAVDTSFRRPQKLASEKHLPQQKSNPNINERQPVGQKHANVCRPDLSVNETMVEELDKAEGSSTRRIHEERKWQLKVYPLHAEDLHLNYMGKICKVASESRLYIPSEGWHWKAELYVATQEETVTIIGKLLRMEFHHNMLSIEVVRKDTGGKEDGTESKKECKAFLMFDKFLSKKIFDARSEKDILVERIVTLTKLPKAATKDFIGALFPFATEIEIIDSDDPDERKATVRCKTLATSLLVYKRHRSILQFKRLEINDVQVKVSIDESGMREYPMGPGRRRIMERPIDRRNRDRDSIERNVTKEMLQLQNQLNQAIKNQIAMLNETQVGGSHMLPNNYPDHAPRHFGGESLTSARVIDHHHQSGFGGVSWSSDCGGRIDREVRNEPNRPDKLGRSGVDRMERPNRPDIRMEINVRIDNQPARLERNSRDWNDRNGEGADTIRHKNPRQSPAFGGGSSSDAGRNNGDRSSLNRSHGSERGTSYVRRGPEYPNSDRSAQRNDRTYNSATHGQASSSTRYGDYPQAEGHNSCCCHY